MRGESRENVVRILPYGLGNDERRLRINAAKYIDAFPLAGDETVLQRGIVTVSAGDGISLILQRRAQGHFHPGLRGPADLIGR